MKEQRFPEPTTDDQPALDALVSIDPADAPDIAEGIAASLQRELDQTGISPGAEDTS